MNIMNFIKNIITALNNIFYLLVFVAMNAVILLLILSTYFIINWKDYLPIVLALVLIFVTFYTIYMSMSQPNNNTPRQGRRLFSIGLVIFLVLDSVALFNKVVQDENQTSRRKILPTPPPSQRGSTLLSHPYSSTIRAITWSPKGDMIAVGGDDHKVQVLNANVYEAISVKLFSLCNIKVT